MENTKSKRIKKFNSGAGAILCNGCNVIVKEGFVSLDKATIDWYRHNLSGARIHLEDWVSNEPLYCKACEEEAKKRAKNYMNLP